MSCYTLKLPVNLEIISRYFQIQKEGGPLKEDLLNHFLIKVIPTKTTHKWSNFLKFQLEKNFKSFPFAADSMQKCHSKKNLWNINKLRQVFINLKHGLGPH